MNDLDPVFLTALHERAGGDVRVEPLLDGARRRGVRHRRNRRLAVGAGAAAAVAAVLAATALLPRGGNESAPPATTGTPSAARTTAVPSPTASRWARPPEATGLRPLTAGGAVGEGRQFHLDVADPDLMTVNWASGTGEQIVAIRRKASAFGYSRYTIVAATTADALDQLVQRAGGLPAGTPHSETLTVAGRPATLRWTPNGAILRWPALDNAWVSAIVPFHADEADPAGPMGAAEARGSVLEIAGFLRLDRVLSCGVEFRLGWAPAGTRTSTCARTWPGTRLTMMSFAFDGGEFWVSETSDEVQPNTTYAGRPVEYAREGSKIAVGDRRFLIEPGRSGLGRDAMLHVLTGLQLAPATADPLS